MTRWFVSDHHFWHDNIIRYCNRPFANVKEMNEALLTYHNEIVKPEDHVSFLGDVTIWRGGRIQRDLFCKFIRSFNGHKRLFLGNHDHWPVQVYLDAGFEKIYATWRDESGLLFSHIPIHGQSFGSARANVHGHIHNNEVYKPVVYVDKEQRVRTKPYINVSVEVIDYKPISHEQIMSMVTKVQGEYEGVKV